MNIFKKNELVNTNNIGTSAGKSFFITGATGSGKSVLVDKLVENLVKRYKPQDLRFVLLDMTGLDFWDLRKNSPGYIDVYIGGFPDAGLYLLEKMANIAAERVKKSGDYPLHFIFIEECDMAYVDQKRFDDAIIRILELEKKANMQIVYSTSRPDDKCASKRLLNAFDQILIGSYPWPIPQIGYKGVKDHPNYQFQQIKPV